MSESDIDQAFYDITELLHHISDTLPHTTFKKNLKPFWNKELSVLKFRKVNLYRAWDSAGRPRKPENRLYNSYKSDKKLFHKTIKELTKLHENEEILKAIKTSELDRNSFWKLIHTARKSRVKGVSAIKRPDDVVVYELNEVLQVWADHFLNIGTPKENPNFKEDHFRYVSDFISNYNELVDEDGFNDDEMYRAVKTLHLRKAPGVDSITSEHLIYAGPVLLDYTTLLENLNTFLKALNVEFKFHHIRVRTPASLMLIELDSIPTAILNWHFLRIDTQEMHIPSAISILGTDLRGLIP